VVNTCKILWSARLNTSRVTENRDLSSHVRSYEEIRGRWSCCYNDALQYYKDFNHHLLIMPVQCHIAGRSSNRMRKEIRSNVTLRGTMPFVYRPINIYIFRPKRTMCTSKSLRLVAWVGDVWHLAKDISQAWDLCTAYETYQHCASYCVCQYTVLSGYIIPHLISTKPSYTGDRRNNNCQTSRQLAMSNLICSCARTLPLLLSSAQRLIRRACTGSRRTVNAGFVRRTVRH